MTTTTKTNGYTASALQPTISLFERAAEIMFPDCTLEHFYYGDKIDMVDLIISKGRYAHFSISINRVGLGGYTCSSEELAAFEAMTLNDRLYESHLIEIVENGGLKK